jgi:hypothetical protein
MADYFTGYQNALPQTSLADMMGLASSAQQYKQAQAVNPLELQAKQMAIEQLSRMNPELLKKAIADAQSAQTQSQTLSATQGPTIARAGAEADKATAESRSAQLKTMTDFAQRGTNIAYQLLDDKNLTRQKVVDAITNHMEQLPWVKPRDINVAVSQIPDVDGEALKPHLIDYIRSNNDGLINALNSKYAPSSLVSAGNQILPVSTANQALTNVAPGTSTGSGIKIGLPPTQQFVDEKGAKFILGANGQRQYTEVGPAATSAQTAFGTASGADFATTIADANAATNTRAIYDKIRAALPLAFTGVGSGKKQFMSKVAQAIGIPLNTLETTNTEELVKNSKLLQAVGGNTDAARAIAELANPNENMTEAGNRKIINQLDGQEKFKEKKADFLEPVAGDPIAYQQRLRQWNSAADPLFFTEMEQSDAAQMMQTMSAARRAELLQKRDRAKALGIIK